MQRKRPLDRERRALGLGQLAIVESTHVAPRSRPVLVVWPTLLLARDVELD